MADGVDYVELPTWKVFFIQLLNIAGTGPIFGALMGAVFGPVVFLWIVFGNILGGAVHDYCTGMISLRMNGASLSELVGKYLGKGMKLVIRLFTVVLIILVGAVFVTSPATLLALLTPEALNLTFWVVGIGGGILLGGYHIPELTLANLHPAGKPIWPYMCITVACGAISGFHATQSGVVYDTFPPLFWAWQAARWRWWAWWCAPSPAGTRHSARHGSLWPNGSTSTKAG